MAASLDQPVADFNAAATSGQHGHHPALVIGDARPPGLVGADPFILLERVVELEHGIEVADQQQPLGAGLALMLGDEMPGAADRAR